ncbi:hypothetical protein H1R20_g4375, partial [Candolleomyces eurysporus]
MPGNYSVDTALTDARETDIVIPIMGATGAGKSSFINALLDYFGIVKHFEVGSALASCTSDLESVVIEGQTNNWKRIRGHRIVIVDTPGFDDTYAGDFEILQRIARWLEESYRKKTVLGGVIYLHNISQNRFTGTARRNLEIFNHLCGESALDKVVLVTSHWGTAPDQIFDKREEELKKRYWNTMMDGGTRVERLVAGEEQASAWNIFHSILERVETRAIQQIRPEGLQIQRELVNERKLLPQTHAARELRAQLEQMVEAQTQIQALKADAAAGNAEAMAQLEEQEAKVKQMAQQIENLKVPFPMRLVQWMKLVVGRWIWVG